MTTWAVVLVLGAAALLLLEMAIPSFGLFGLLAAAAYTYALIIGFRESAEMGIQVVALGVILAPFAFFGGLKLLGKTRLGRRSMLEPPKAAEIGRMGADAHEKLVGQFGTALTDLRPVGRAEIDGARYDVVAAFGMVAKDASLRVVQVEGSRIVVEAA